MFTRQQGGPDDAEVEFFNTLPVDEDAIRRVFGVPTTDSEIGSMWWFLSEVDLWQLICLADNETDFAVYSEDLSSAPQFELWVLDRLRGLVDDSYIAAMRHGDIGVTTIVNHSDALYRAYDESALRIIQAVPVVSFTRHSLPGGHFYIEFGEDWLYAYCHALTHEWQVVVSGGVVINQADDLL